MRSFPVLPVHLSWGNVMRLRTLLQAGLTDYEVRQLRDEGTLTRLRHGWYAGSRANEHVVAAVRSGGVLGCVSALGFHGVWQPIDQPLHVYRAKWGRQHGTSKTVWCREPRSRSSPAAAVLPVDEALRQSLHCVPAEVVLAMAESILRQGKLGYAEVAHLLGPLGHRLDKSDSGTETLVRERLRRLGVKVRPHVHIEDVGWVDLLIGDLLVLEVDSKTFHWTDRGYQEDRRRDLNLVAHGYLVIRITWEQVMLGWAPVEEVVLGIIRQKRHLKRARR